MTRRYALRDDQWERIKDLLPGREETVGVTAKNNRLFVEAVLYRYRAGIPWRDFAFKIWRLSRKYILDIADGVEQEYGKEYFNILLEIATMSIK